MDPFILSRYDLCSFITRARQSAPRPTEPGGQPPSYKITKIHQLIDFADRNTTYLVRYQGAERGVPGRCQSSCHVCTCCTSCAFYMLYYCTTQCFQSSVYSDSEPSEPYRPSIWMETSARDQKHRAVGTHALSSYCQSGFWLSSILNSSTTQSPI